MIDRQTDWLIHFTVTVCMLSCSAMSDSLWPHGLWPAQLPCPWGFSRQEYWNGLPCSLPGDLPNSGIQPRFPTLQILYSLSHQNIIFQPLFSTYYTVESSRVFVKKTNSSLPAFLNQNIMKVRPRDLRVTRFSSWNC